MIKYSKAIFFIYFLIFYLIIDLNAFAQSDKIYFEGDSVNLYPYYFPSPRPWDFDEKDPIWFPEILSNGKWIQYYQDSTTVAVKGEYKNTVKEGEWKFYDTDGKLFYTHIYKKGILNIYRTYFANENVSQEFTYGSNRIVQVKEWYENGNLKYLGDANHQFFWYENGQKKIEKFYKDKLLHGVITSWYEDGTLQYRAAWNNGIQDTKCLYAKRNRHLRERTYNELPKNMKYIINYKKF